MRRHICTKYIEVVQTVVTLQFSLYYFEVPRKDTYTARDTMHKISAIFTHDVRPYGKEKHSTTLHEAWPGGSPNSRDLL